MTKSTKYFTPNDRPLNDFEIAKIVKINDKANELLELLKMENKSEEEVFYKEARINLEATVMWATRAVKC